MFLSAYLHGTPQAAQSFLDIKAINMVLLRSTLLAKPSFI